MALQVDFHTGVADPLHFACRLVRKAVRQGVRVVVTAPSALAHAFDRELWTFEEREFVAHVRVDARAPGDVARRTPVWVVDGEIPEGAPEVLVNLGADIPERLERFSRVVEIVSVEPDDVVRARSRWRRYAELGATVKHHAAAER